MDRVDGFWLQGWFGEGDVEPLFFFWMEYAYIHRVPWFASGSKLAPPSDPTLVPSLPPFSPPPHHPSTLAVPATELSQLPLRHLALAFAAATVQERLLHSSTDVLRLALGGAQPSIERLRAPRLQYGVHALLHLTPGPLEPVQLQQVLLRCVAQLQQPLVRVDHVLRERRRGGQMRGQRRRVERWMRG